MRADKWLMLQDADIWNQLFGFSVVILQRDRFDSYNVQAWNPMCDGIGFAFTDFDEYGTPSEIEISYDTSSASVEMAAKGVKIQAADPEGGQYEGFYAFRTREGLPGPRGLSKILGLIDVLRIQYEVFLEYLKYAKKQGLAHKVVKIKDLNETKYNKYINRVRQTTKDDTVLIDTEDEFDWKSPQQHAYDPLGMLEFADRFLSRDTSLTKFHLVGEGSGHLESSSETTAGFFADIKQEQDYSLPQYLDIFEAFGGDPKKIKFNDPTETTISTLMAGMKLFREALEGLVTPDSLVAAINEYLGLIDDKRLKLLVMSDVEKMKNEKKTTIREPSSRTDGDTTPRLPRQS